jgi:hypothetical protein
MLEGGCFCGQIRYEAHGIPFNATLCHCADCRRVTGAPLVAWFSVARSDFQFVAGNPKRFASSPKVSRSFCPDCGTPLTYHHDDHPTEIDIATCTLDTPETVPPQDHVHTRSELSWVHVNDGLKQYSTTRSAG